VLESYEHTPEGFLDYAKTILAVTPCAREKKVPMWREAQRITEPENWPACAATGLDRLFLACLLPAENRPLPGFLLPPQRLDYQYPDTVMDGIEYQMNDPKQKAAGQNRLGARDERIKRAQIWIAEGGAFEEAVAFVASREEWGEVVRKAGRVAA